MNKYDKNESDYYKSMDKYFKLRYNEITDKQIIGVLPNKSIIRDLSEFTNYMIVKDGIFLMMNNKKEKKYILYIPSKKQELILLFKEKKIKCI